MPTTTFVSVTQMPVKPDNHVTTNVAPATPTHPLATQAVQLAPCVAPATPQPAATAPTLAVPHTLQKTPTVHMPPHAQSVTLKADQTQHLLSLAILLGAVSHHPSLLKRCRPGLTLDDGPDDALTWTASGIHSEMQP